MPTNSDDKPRQGADSEPRQTPTGSDDRATTSGVSVAAVTPSENVTVEEAAAMLDVSPRTIQRRCQSGKLSAKQTQGEFGEVWEIARASVEAMAATERADKPRQQLRQSAATATTGHDSSDDTATTRGASVAAINAAPDDAQHQPRADRDDAAPDFRARYIAQMEAENSFLKSQLEDANRNAAELRAALRKALEIAPRQLVQGTPTDATTPPNANATNRQQEAQNNEAAPLPEPTTAPQQPRRGDGLKMVRDGFKKLFQR